MKKSIVLALLFFLAIGVKAQDTNERPPGDRKGPPSVDQIFEMDTNQDGKLSKTEIKGPLLEDFDKVDADGDGFISRTELEEAPKPKRRPRPKRDN